MASFDLIMAVRTALRITSIDYNDEIDALIDAAVVDLLISGVSAAAVQADAPAALVKQAIILYCKAEFGLDNPDSEKYMASFRSLESHLAMSAEYQQPTGPITAGTMAVGSADLTVDDVEGLEEDVWVSVAGAGAGGALLVAQVESISDSVVTLSRLASTAVTDAVVKIL